MDRELSEPTVRRLTGVGQDLVAELDLEHLLDTILERAVEITEARYAALGVLDESRSGLERFLHRGIDETIRERIGDLPSGRGVLGTLISDPRVLRLRDVSEHHESFGFPPHHPPMKTFLGVPISVFGQPWGNLYLTEKRGGAEFTRADEDAAVALSRWAAIAIGNARSVALDRLRFAMEAAEQERVQWARELHDQTLQGLAAIRLLLATGLRSGDPERLTEGVARSIEQIDTEIASMRALITDLRPDSLVELGVAAALEALAQRIRDRVNGAEVEVETGPGVAEHLSDPAAVAVYRVAQEAMNNAVRHGGAASLKVGPRSSGRSSCSGSVTTAPVSIPLRPSAVSGSGACGSARSSPVAARARSQRRGAGSHPALRSRSPERGRVAPRRSDARAGRSPSRSRARSRRARRGSAGAASAGCGRDATRPCGR